MIPYEIDIIGDPSIVVHQAIPGIERPRSWKYGVKISAYQDRLASSVMADWLQLSERFVADFMRDHAGLLP